MAIEILRMPDHWYSAHSKSLIYAVAEPVKAAANSDYKYVADIYVDTVMIGRLKAVPLPGTLHGIFDIASVVRNYVEITFNPGTGIVAQRYLSGSSYCSVVVKIGEEFGGVLTTNITIAPERKFWNHYNGRLVGKYTALAPLVNKLCTTRPYKGSNVKRDGKFHFIPLMHSSSAARTIRVKTYSESDALLDTQDINITPTTQYGAIQLNVSPEALNADFSGLVDSAVKYYTVELISPSVSGNNLGGINIESASPYRDSNLIIHNNTTSTTLATLATDGATSSHNVAIGHSITVESTAYDNFVADGWFSLLVLKNGLEVYKIEVETGAGTMPFGGSYTFTVEQGCTYEICAKASELQWGFKRIDSLVPLYPSLNSIYRIDIYEEAIHEKHTIHFHSQFLGYESFDFYKLSRRKLEVQRASMEIAQADTYGLTYSGVTMNRNSRNIAVEAKEIMTLNSDNIKADIYSWLSQLILTSSAYIEQEGMLVPIEIVADNFEFKKHENEKLFNLSIDISFTNQENSQYL